MANSYYEYAPSSTAAIIFVSLFGIVTILHLYQLLRTRTWVLIPFLIGGFFEVGGYAGRLASAHQTPDYTLAPFAVQTILLLVAPALFAASIYMVLGRIILLTDGEVHSLIRKKWLTKIFVTGDVLSFLVQVVGGTMIANADTTSDFDRAQNIILIGLAIQLVVFGCFVIIAVLFDIRMKRNPTPKVIASNNTIPYRKHLRILYVTSLLILVRSLVRFIEYIQGHDGYLMGHEWTLYVFDAMLMWGVMVIFALGHPSEVYALLKGGRSKAVRMLVRVYVPREMAKVEGLNWEGERGVQMTGQGEDRV